MGIVKINKKDARGQVIKLDINAIYGKLAQRKGRQASRLNMALYGMPLRLRQERRDSLWKLL